MSGPWYFAHVGHAHGGVLESALLAGGLLVGLVVAVWYLLRQEAAEDDEDPEGDAESRSPQSS
ncbi:MAG TPA: hypothetical protein VIL95_00240 [Bacillota bacterium]